VFGQRIYKKVGRQSSQPRLLEEHNKDLAFPLISVERFNEHDNSQKKFLEKKCDSFSDKVSASTQEE